MRVLLDGRMNVHFVDGCDFYRWRFFVKCHVCLAHDGLKSIDPNCPPRKCEGHSRTNAAKIPQFLKRSFDSID